MTVVPMHVVEAMGQAMISEDMEAGLVPDFSAAADPETLFRVFGIEPERYPVIDRIPAQEFDRIKDMSPSEVLREALNMPPSATLTVNALKAVSAGVISAHGDVLSPEGLALIERHVAVTLLTMVRARGSIRAKEALLSMDSAPEGRLLKSIDQDSSEFNALEKYYKNLTKGKPATKTFAAAVCEHCVSEVAKHEDFTKMPEELVIDAVVVAAIVAANSAAAATKKRKSPKAVAATA